MNSFIRVNIGCGGTPINGWRNFDNSISVQLSRIPLLPKILKRLGIINEKQYHYVLIAKANKIEYGNAIKSIPVPNSSVDVLYSSHMLEHLDLSEVSIFLNEARRVLRSEGTIRIVVPNLKFHVECYLKTEDADKFLANMCLCKPRPKTVFQRIRFVFIGLRNHQWMYDSISLSQLLEKHGFKNISVLKPGETTINQPGLIDLYERQEGSLYVEALNP